ncbi:nitroreductase family protein [Roseobacter sp. EG26]|uniref:nitroreductase family protein n=1 Tax=Roseobacter sp. EG26 TaxID=3412477 RepID=UPI003CE50E76
MSDPTLKSLFRDRFGSAPDVPSEMAEASVLKRIAARGSCRWFDGKVPTQDVLETLCAAALCAPSKSDLQQRDLLIVSDQTMMTELKTLLKAQEWIADAPAMVVFLANNRRQRQIQTWHDQPFPNDHLDAFFNASLDAGIALAFFMAAAENAGLGCCPISTIRNHLPEVKDLLQLPNHVFPVAGLAVGYPRYEPRVSARLPLEATVHHNSFADTSKEQVLAYDARRLAGSEGPGWSDAKARMYAEPQRQDFAAFMRKIGFNLD